MEIIADPSLIISEPIVEPPRATLDRSGPGLDEVMAVWFGWAAITALLFITYSRIQPGLLYNVSRSGLAGGAGRALVVLNFPIALVAIAIAGILAARLRQTETELAPTARRLMTAGLVSGVVLCAIVAVPGVVSQSNLDARWINVPAAVGVLLLVTVTIAATRACGRGRADSFNASDHTRIALAALLALLSLPWLFAEAGMYIGRVPVIGVVFLSERVPAGETEAAVHLGHHHGADGFYLVVTALALSRVLSRINAGRLRGALGAYLALMLAYGLGNMANDAWTEQIWKRGWTTRTAPSVLVPALTPAWGLLLIIATGLYFLFFRAKVSDWRAETRNEKLGTES
jgi:hypothetical protein